MSITDELRKYVQSWRETPNLMDDLDAGDIDGLLGDFEHIADHIDAEHEAMLEDARKYVYAGYVELPKDADGEYIHVGDVMEWVRYEGSDQTIVRTVSGIGNGVFFAWSDEQGRYAQYEAHAYRHHHAPTVEDVLTEFGIDWEYESDCEDRAALLKEYAAKLRLAEGEDE